MEIEVLKAKAEQSIRVLSVKVNELDNQKQRISSEILRLQGENRAYDKMAEAESISEDDRPTQKLEKKEKTEGEN